jgi:P27 family predicted phage terminase small subunit
MGLRGPKSANEVLFNAQHRRENADRFAANPVKPPAHLTPSTKQWWAETAPLLEPHQLRILTAGGEAWDRYQQAREALAKHGLSYTDDKGQVRRRPECTIEKDARAAFLRCMYVLRLDVPPPQPPKNFPTPWEQEHWDKRS